MEHSNSDLRGRGNPLWLFRFTSSRKRSRPSTGAANELFFAPVGHARNLGLKWGYRHPRVMMPSTNIANATMLEAP